MRLTGAARARLRCPRCHSELAEIDADLQCIGPCGRKHPVVGGVPVLIDDDRSVFTAAELIASRARPDRNKPSPRQRVGRLLPSLSLNVVSATSYRRVAEALAARPERRVLTVGGGRLGVGMDALLKVPDVELVETDVYFT